MILFRNLDRKRKAWHDGVAHATLDPEGPGVARLHLVPPKPVLFGNPPSQLLINGTWFLPVGPSWAAVLRIFFEELQRCCTDKREISPEEIKQIEQAVVAHVTKLYPKTDRDLILNDLKEIVTLAVNIATNHDVPEETHAGLNLEQYSRYMTAPHRMDLIVAPMSTNGRRACPLECACCYADSGQVMDIEKPLSTEDWKDIIDKCKAAGIPMLTFTGGEPLTRPDIVDLVRHAAWFVTRLNTSAYNLTPELAAALQSASLDGMQITLYSHNPEIHDTLVGKKGAWERTVAGIKIARDTGLSVSINTPIVERNRDYADTLRFVHSLGIHCVGCSSLIPTGGAVEQIATGKALTPEELKDILREAVALCKELKMEISFTSPGWLPSEEILALGLPSAPVCGACLSNMAVTPAGDVVPCQSWLNGQTLGSMRTETWRKIWNNKTCINIRKNSAAKPKCALKEV
ncbi:MAG: Radical domain protein [Clostridia bacterium]|jgi:MoaA/NifB/PqqE/SkfB family radical SAM enzyme|nr:Radical domain protein [Clostridia bacterium]